MRYILPLISLFGLLFVTEASAQRRELRKAHDAYEEANYYHCYEYFNQAIEKGAALTLEEQKMQGHALYELNYVDEAFNILSTIETELSGEYVLIYAMVLHRMTLYEQAIEWYDKAKKSGVSMSPKRITDRIEACRWAAANNGIDPTVNVAWNMTMMDNGQAFGIQVYNDYVVFSKAASDSKERDRLGNPFLSLHKQKYVNGEIVGQPEIFSKNLQSPYHVGAISFTKDKKHIFFTKTVYVGSESMLKIYVADFDGKEWVNERVLEFDSDDFDFAHPYVSPDDKYLYFVSNMQDHTKIYGKSVRNYGGKDIYRAEFAGDVNHFSKVENLGPDVNSYGEEIYPVLNTDGYLYFSSDTWPGLGSYDIFKAEFVDGKWQNVRNMLAPFNSAADDFYYLRFSPDEINGFLSSNRSGNQRVDYIWDVRPKAPETKEEVNIELPPIFGDQNIEMPPLQQLGEPEMAPSPEPVVSVITMTFASKVYSTFNNELVPGAKVVFVNEETDKEIASGLANESGEVSIEINPETVADKEILVVVTKDGFNERTMQITEAELAQLAKDGLFLTPIFNDAVLDEISEMGFAYKKDLDVEAKKTLDKLAGYLLASPGTVVKINAHTEAKGNKYTNLDESQRIADLAKEYLLAKGVKSNQVIPRGYGERYLKNRCFRGRYCDAATHAVNRRVEIVVANSKK